MVITDVKQVTPDWLNQRLLDVGVLRSGRVTHIFYEIGKTFTATAVPLQVRYSADTPRYMPEKLFLKLGRRKPEVDFYHHILPQTVKLPTIRCYDAAFDNARECSHLLMDDISETHVEPPDMLPLPIEQVKQVIEILAGFHAQWWENSRLKDDLRPVLDDVPGFILSQARGHFAHFADALGDRLSDKRKQWYERILAGLPLPAWQERIQQHRAVTLVHGDSHWWNFLLPKDKGQILLIDWAVWHLNVAPSDLAYTFGNLCFSEWRARFEQPMLRYYYEQLTARGVSGYDWAQCWQDYRMAMVFHTLWPIFHHQWAPNVIWWRSLECNMTAFEELGCEEFIS